MEEGKKKTAVALHRLPELSNFSRAHLKEVTRTLNTTSKKETFSVEAGELSCLIIIQCRIYIHTPVANLISLKAGTVFAYLRE